MKKEDISKAQGHSVSVLETVTDCVVAINRNFQIIMANDLFKTEFGDHSGDFCYKAWKKGDKKCADCLVEKSFADGEVHYAEETVFTADGQTAQMAVKSIPVMNEKGEVAYVIERGTNITERNRLESDLHDLESPLEKIVADRLKFLQKSEEKYRTIFERSQDAIILTDPEGKIIEINQAGIELLGYDSKEDSQIKVSGFSFFENEEDIPKFQKMVFRDGFTDGFETRFRGKNNQVFDALISANFINLDQEQTVTGYVLIIRDITTSKEAHRQIEERNVRLATLNAISQTVSWSLDLSDVLKSAISKIIEVLETDSVRVYLIDSKEEILALAAHKGLSVSFVKKDCFVSRKIGDGLLGQTFQKGKAKVVENLRRAEDPYVDSMIEEGLQSTAYIPLVSKGKPVGVMAVSSNSIMEYSANHVDFLTAIGNQIGMAVDNANLYENLKRAYAELMEAQDQVIRSEKLASLGKLSATIAHEINNPLATVLTYIKLMGKLVDKGRFKQDRLDDIARYLSTMASETTRCGEIVKNLLAFSRHSKINIGTHYIEEIITKTLPLISHDLEMKEIRLEKQVDEDLPPIRCDLRQIQQALLNLLGNASEAVEGGGCITLKAAVQEDANFVEITISDTGGGIPQDDIDHIFEPFFTTKDEGKGVGLGLSVVFGIITKHGGSIEVESKEGEGSSFKIRLPVGQ